VPPPLVAVALTTMVPFIRDGWMLQWYGKEPSVAKVWLKVCPGCNWLLAKSAKVTVCAVAPLLVHFTVVPGLTVVVAGWNAKSIMLTVFSDVPLGEVGVVLGMVGVVGVVLDVLLQPAVTASATIRPTTTNESILRSMSPPLARFPRARSPPGVARRSELNIGRGVRQSSRGVARNTAEEGARRAWASTSSQRLRPCILWSRPVL